MDEPEDHPRHEGARGAATNNWNQRAMVPGTGIGPTIFDRVRQWAGNLVIRCPFHHCSRSKFMRLAIVAVGLILGIGTVAAQQTPRADPGKESQNTPGRTIIPEKMGPAQPQGHTGPIDTKSGGAPAESPQGQTP